MKTTNNIKNMNNMKVTLLNYTPLWVCSQAIRTCWQSQGNSDTYFDKRGNPYWMIGSEDCDVVNSGIGPKDRELIDRIGNKFKHASTLEHLYYNFKIENVSRALLQELARHRIASPSVKSTRYTLKELKNEESFEKPFTSFDENNKKVFDINNARHRAAKYLVFTGNDKVDKYSIYALENLRKLIVDGVRNDEAKYALPESYKLELAWSINARSLQNFLHLRSSKAALWEIRDLAQIMYDTLPEDHKYLFSLANEDNEDKDH